MSSVAGVGGMPLALGLGQGTGTGLQSKAIVVLR